MGKVIYYVAISVDGYIAADDGGIDWLNNFPVEGVDLGFDAFYETVDAVVLGAATYEQVLGFGAWPYAQAEAVVLTRRELPQPQGGTVRFSTDPVAAVLADLSARHAGTVWLVGGGKLAAAAQAADAIDEYDIAVIPLLLGAGIPLLAPAAQTAQQNLRLIAHQAFSNGVVRLRYARDRDGA